MPLALILVCVALLLATGAGAIAARQDATRLVYGACLALTSLALIVALAHLASGGDPATIVLPLGLPWIGAHFGLDALAAFFLAVVNLGGAAASAYASAMAGMSRRRRASCRSSPRSSLR